MIYVIGAGGFAREVLNIFTDLSRNKEVVAFLEENCRSKGTHLNEKPVEDFSILNEKNLKNDIKLICAIATPLRKRLIEHTRQLGYRYETAIHPSVIMSKWVSIGEGNIICAGNILTNQITLGEFVIINLACTIGHDVKIGKYTTLSPGVNVSGRVNIGDECYIGTGATIIEKVNIGNKSYIAAGAVVVSDIPENVLAVGIPAKPVRKLNDADWAKLM
jgi:sugar O-acyltransferase (sialic acid O-acetyltransferase NeuD family)